jgi:hypothetical protein
LGTISRAEEEAILQWREETVTEGAKPNRESVRLLFGNHQFSIANSGADREIQVNLLNHLTRVRHTQQEREFRDPEEKKDTKEESQ